MSNVKLKEDEREIVTGLVSGQGWPILSRIIEAACSEIDSNMLRYTLGKETDQQNLVILKAKSEGARSLQLRIQQLKQQFKEP